VIHSHPHWLIIMPSPSGTTRKARFGVYEVDFRAGELLKSGRRIRLQDQPLRVLEMLLENPGEAITREELRQKLWPGDTFVDFDHGLNNAINRLREALNDSADRPRFIETLPRRGYRFVAKVSYETVSDLRAETASTVEPSGSAEPSCTTPGTSEIAKSRSVQPVRRPIRLWLLAGTAVAVALLVFVLLRYRHPFGSSAAMRIQSIAILPLENLSGDPSEDNFAIGLTDDLTTSLAQLRGLRVISRTSATLLKATKKPLPEIAKEFGLDAVVEGSVSRSKGRIRVNTQLIYAQRDSHIWAHEYEGPSTDPANMEHQIANDIAVRVGAGVALPPGDRSVRALTVNSDAYDLYLRSAAYYGLEKREANEQAVALLEKSVELDRQFAPAFAALATAYRVRAFSVEVHDPKWIEKANAAVTQALTLDPNLAEGYVSRGYLLWSPANDWAVQRAVTDYRHALELNPNLAEAHHQLANVYNHVGLLDKADAEIKKAVEIDPLNTGIRYRVGVNLLYRGRYEESIPELRDSEKMLPGLWAFQTSFALQHLGRRQEAEERISRMLKTIPTDPGGSLSSMQALLAADAGDAPLAQRKIQEAIAKGKGYQHFHHVAYAIASAYALLHKREEALHYLQMAAEDGFPCYPLFEHDSNLDHLRNDPGFLNFLTEQKKQWEYFRAHV